MVAELSVSAIAPAGTVNGWQPSVTGAVPSLTRTIGPFSPAAVGAGVKRA